MIQFVALTCAAYRRFVPHSPLHGIAPLTLWAVVSQLAQPACSSTANADSGTRPNIVVILADDNYHEFAKTSHPQREKRHFWPFFQLAQITENLAKSNEIVGE